jgi:hypothetical protein
MDMARPAKGNSKKWHLVETDEQETPLLQIPMPHLTPPLISQCLARRKDGIWKCPMTLETNLAALRRVRLLLSD